MPRRSSCPNSQSTRPPRRAGRHARARTPWRGGGTAVQAGRVPQRHIVGLCLVLLERPPLPNQSTAPPPARARREHGRADWQQKVIGVPGSSLCVMPSQAWQHVPTTGRQLQPSRLRSRSAGRRRRAAATARPPRPRPPRCYCSLRPRRTRATHSCSPFLCTTSHESGSPDSTYSLQPGYVPPGFAARRRTRVPAFPRSPRTPCAPSSGRVVTRRNGIAI